MKFDKNEARLGGLALGTSSKSHDKGSGALEVVTIFITLSYIIKSFHSSSFYSPSLRGVLADLKSPRWAGGEKTYEIEFKRAIGVRSGNF